jgi:hypothetical protein
MKTMLCLLLLSLAPIVALADEISIVPPNDPVGPVVTFSGRSPVENAIIYLIVNPLETPQQFWVQARAVVDRRKNWFGSAHLGDPGPAHRNQKFVVYAVANPEVPLHTGDVLSDLPPARWTSAPVIVTRK